MKTTVIVIVLVLLFGCRDKMNGSDSKQAAQQEKILAEGTAQIGMPSIVNFRERKLLKDIFELRDQMGFSTYTYLVGDDDIKMVFLCDSIGYGIPYATQFTNPEKIAVRDSEHGYVTMPQADPNGLFSPASAEGTWIMCKDPNGKDVHVVYIEPRIIVSPFLLITAPTETEAEK
jgi:hypothetical protein